MGKGESNIIHRRLANSYFSSVISISLVLLLVGVASMLLVNGKTVSDYFKENMRISILMKPEVDEVSALEFKKTLDKKRFLRSSEVISRERGAEEMAALLGEDFLDVFEISPIPVSIEVTVDAGYVSADSIEVVKKEISADRRVEEVVYQESLVNALNANLGRISVVIGVFVALLLFVSFVLINNTVRLNVYSRRFTVHTMRLVGATRAFIRAPFLLQAVFQGLFSAFVAIIALIALLFVLRSEFAQLFSIFKVEMLLLVMLIVLVAGVFICLSSTWFVVNKLVSLKKDELYY